jgi:hypothetical protein
MKHSPLDNLLHGPRRAGATWLAFAALLGNILLPAALSIFVLTELRGGAALCAQSPGNASGGNAPGKAKPGLLVQHCPLCTVPAAPLPRPPTMVVPGEVADQTQVQRLTTVSVAPIRHGRMQARAPPSIV